MYAIIHDGGKQYKVIPGQSVELEFKEFKAIPASSADAKPEIIPMDVGTKVELDKVIFYNDDKEILVGTPYLTNIKIKGYVEQQHLGEKIDMMKWRKNGNSHTKKGHRQIYTRVRVSEIVRTDVPQTEEKK